MLAGLGKSGPTPSNIVDTTISTSTTTTTTTTTISTTTTTYAPLSSPLSPLPTTEVVTALHSRLNRGTVLAGKEASGVDGLSLGEKVGSLASVGLLRRQPLDGGAARRGAEGYLNLDATSQTDVKKKNDGICMMRDKK